MTEQTPADAHDWPADYTMSADALDEHAADHDEQADHDQTDDDLDLDGWLASALAERAHHAQVLSGTRRAGWQD